MIRRSFFVRRLSSRCRLRESVSSFVRLNSSRDFGKIWRRERACSASGPQEERVRCSCWMRCWSCRGEARKASISGLGMKERSSDVSYSGGGVFRSRI